MKRKQVMALMLTGMLTVGSVTPVHAQESADPAQNPVQTQEQVQGEAKENAAPAEQKEEVKENTGVQAPQENQAQEPAKEEAVPQASSDMPELTTTQAMVDSAKAEVLSMVAKIKEIDNYLGENDPYLQQTLWEFMEGNVLEVEQWANAYMSEFFNVGNSDFSDAADAIIAQLDDYYAYACELKVLVGSQKEYSQQQLNLSISAMTKLIKVEAVLYKDEYVQKVEAALKKAKAVVVTEENAKDIIGMIDEWNQLLGQGQVNLDDRIYRDFIEIADNYPALYALAPESITKASEAVVTVYKNYTYSEFVDVLPKLKQEAEARKAKLNRGEMAVSEASGDKDYLYGNGRTVWGNTVTAIAKDGREFLNQVKGLGVKTDEYEAVLAELEQQAALFNNYGNVVKLAQKLKETRKTIESSAMEMLKNAQADLQKTYDRITADYAQGYMKEEYIQKVEKAVKDNDALLKDEDTDEEKLLAAAKQAKELVSQEAYNYTDKLSQSLDDLYNCNKTAVYIFSVAAQESQDKYADAVKKAQEYVQFTEAQKDALKNGQTVDLEKLTKLLEESKKGHAKDGVIHTAIADVLEKDLIPNAEALLKEEKNNKHTEGLIASMESAVTELKKAYAQWLEDGDYMKLQSGVKALADAADRLTKDKPSANPDTKPETKPENTTDKKDDKKKEDKKKKDNTKKKAAHTGDNTEAGGAGLLALASAAVLAGMKKKRP